MRSLITITAMVLLCTACSNEPVHDHRWFNTYQTDRTCQGNHKLPPEDPFEKGPTGRAHPF